MRAPVDPAARLQPVPAAGLPAGAAEVLNENAERLKATPLAERVPVTDEDDEPDGSPPPTMDGPWWKT